MSGDDQPKPHLNNRQTPRVIEWPGPLYHGTRSVLGAGEVLKGGLGAGKSRGRYVWLDPDPARCEAWGHASRGAGTVHVYEVRPVGITETCRGAIRARSAVVVKEV